MLTKLSYVQNQCTESAVMGWRILPDPAHYNSLPIPGGILFFVMDKNKISVQFLMKEQPEKLVKVPFIVFKVGTFYCKQEMTFPGILGAQGWDTDREPKPKIGARFGNILLYEAGTFIRSSKPNNS
jgi:hypothetical protein